MGFVLDEIVKKINAANPRHGKKVIANMEQLAPFFKEKSENYFQKLIDVLKAKNRDLDYGVECYLKLTNDMLFEQLKFRKTGKYSNDSFNDVFQKVYNNPEVMEYHMIGLMISQFLWKQHFDVLGFFIEKIKKYQNQTKRYLEIGGGHGLYVSEATQVLKSCHFDLIDISPSSIEIAKKFISNDVVNYICADIFDFVPKKKYDFITLGEVLEHVEKPKELLAKIHTFLNPGGILFISVPVNSPAIDHIYLFKHEDEIREMVEDKYSVIDEKLILTEDIAIEKAREYKVALMYSAFLKSK